MKRAISALIALLLLAAPVAADGIVNTGATGNLTLPLSCTQGGNGVAGGAWTVTTPTAIPNTSGSITAVTAVHTLVECKKVHITGTVAVSATSSPVGALNVPIPVAPVLAGSCSAINTTTLTPLLCRLLPAASFLLIYSNAGADPAYGNFTYSFNVMFDTN